MLVRDCWRVRKDLQIETKKMKQMDMEAIYFRKKNKNLVKNFMVLYEDCPESLCHVL